MKKKLTPQQKRRRRAEAISCVDLSAENLGLSHRILSTEKFTDSLDAEYAAIELEDLSNEAFALSEDATALAKIFYAEAEALADKEG